jgi:hypothetical protein
MNETQISIDKRIRCKLLTVVLIALCGTSVFAREDLIVPLTIAVTGTVKFKKTDSTGTVTTMTEKSVHWTSETLIELLDLDGDVTLAGPLSHYSLYYDITTPSDLIISKRDADTNDVTSYFSLSYATGISAGTTNAATSAYTAATTVPMEIGFDDNNGNSFTLSGLGKITSVSTAQTDKAGNPLLKYSISYTFTFTGTGPGAVLGVPAVFSGSISFKGSQTISNSGN